MRAVIQIKRASQVVMAGLSFDSTWLMESDISTTRANLVNMEGVFGEWELRQLTVKNIQGMNNPYFTAALYSYITFSGVDPILAQSTWFPLFRYLKSD